MEGLSDSGVDEDGACLIEGRRREVRRLGELRHRGPGVYPVSIGRVRSDGASYEVVGC